MTFAEFLSTNGVTTKMVNGEEEDFGLSNIIGKEVWICDYRLNAKRDEKPIRNITPKLVRVMDTDDLPDSKCIYYASVYFREIKKGKLLAAVIAPYDNTGYRTYTGVSVNIFYTEAECRACFAEQCELAKEQYREVISAIEVRIQAIDALKESNK